MYSDRRGKGMGIKSRLLAASARHCLKRVERVKASCAEIQGLIRVALAALKL